VQGSIGAFQDLERDGMKPLEQLKKIREALGNDLRLDMLKLSRVPNERPAGTEPVFDAEGKEIKTRPGMEAILQLSFPPTIEPDAGVREITNLEWRLKQAFPSYKVSIDKQVADMIYTESFSSQAGTGAEERTENYIAVLSIKGTLP
jgi:hypothetical protein